MVINGLLFFRYSKRKDIRVKHAVVQIFQALTHYLKIHTNIPSKNIGRIARSFKSKTVKRNELLLSAGEECKALYFVYKGCIRTYYLSEEGREKTRFIAFEGSVVTSLAAFISQEPSFEYVEALENSELLFISRDDFYKLLSAIPEMDFFYRNFLEMAYIYQNKRIESLVTLSAKQRYDKLLNEHPHYSQRISNKILASYLDITQETLSRLKSL